MGSTPTLPIQKTPAAPEQRLFTPHGVARKLWFSQAPEVLLSGPAGTGKSRTNLEKLHWLAGKYPGFRGLILRKTRASLTESGLVTFEEHVVQPGHPILRGASRPMRQSYRYPNGSIIAVGGLDKPGRIMSTEWDAAFVQEAIELSEDAWESLTTRIGRRGLLPYSQLMADTNPDRPSHWLKRRCDAGKCLLLESRHEDNPALWDRRKQEWTAVGRKYIATLDALTGMRYLRLRKGLWVQAEGVVYEDWDPAVHLVDRFLIPPDWPRAVSIDWGYRAPFVAQWWAIDHNGALYRYREIYRTNRIVEDHARDVLRLSSGEPLPVAVVCDHDLEDRMTFERYTGWETTPATKGPGSVVMGCQAVMQRLRRGADGRPRLFFLRDSLVERDPDLEAARKPCCTEEEFESYIWDTRQGRRKGDEPVKENDHGMDACRYMVWGMDCGNGDVDDG